MELLIVQFYPPFGPDILLSTLFSNILNLWFFFKNVKDQISQSYKTTDKILLVYFNIYVFRHQTGIQKILDCSGLNRPSVSFAR
jgi:hypothetical protein